MNRARDQFLAGAGFALDSHSQSTGATRLTSSSRPRNFVLAPINSKIAILFLLVWTNTGNLPTLRTSRRCDPLSNIRRTISKLDTVLLAVI